jgi:NAD(P)-dependent dehydrogenase (short-subunit alcohol dehydrogenase family)
VSESTQTGGARLKGKVILVTGSTAGIGEGMARIFASQGAHVMVHGPLHDQAKRIALEIGADASYVAGSLEDPVVPGRLIEETVARFGRIDGLVNNAAVMTRGTIEETDSEAFDYTVAVNLKAPFFLIRSVLPHFRRQGGGRILNIGSVNAYCGERSQCIYSACKGALMTLTRNVADAYAEEGVCANQLNVGWTLTPNERALKIKEGLPEDWPTKLPKAYAPTGRLLSPEDVAWAAVYFLSDESALINGTVLDLNQYPMIGRNPSKEIVR